MIEPGTELRSRWGDTSVVYRHDAGGGIYLQTDGAARSAFVLIAPAQLGRDYHPTGIVRPDPRHPDYRGALPPVASPEATPTPPTDTATTAAGAQVEGLFDSPGTGALAYLARLPAPTPPTLGALQPSRAFWSVPTQEVAYWRPCLTPAPDGSEPHCHFIASNFEPQWYCPACHPNRIRLSEVDPPAPWSVAVPLTPWGDQAPIWETANRPALREVYEERAGVLQYEGGLPQRAAEAQAYRELVTRFTKAVEARAAQLGLL